MKYPHEKYRGGNYAQIARILYEYTDNSLANVQQFARRLLVNILLANGDAHLKNWSVIYPDTITPTLSPAYDIVFTQAYILGEKSFALNLAKTKNWYEVNNSHFEHLAKKSGVPWRAVKPHLEDTMDKARTLWHTQLEDLPMADNHKILLQQHWQNLHPAFRI